MSNRRLLESRETQMCENYGDQLALESVRKTLDEQRAEIRELKSLLDQCAKALWQPHNYTSQQMLDFIEQAGAASQEGRER
jgi:hypothetical protein